MKNLSYDVYISYTESDKARGIERTPDSIDAQELYQALTDEGYRAFFSRVSLRTASPEEKGVYAERALDASHVLIVFGERANYLGGDEMKAEWSSFASKIERGEKHADSIIVLYKGLDPDELPSDLRKYKAINFASFSAATTLFDEIERVLDAEYDEATLEERERERIGREEEDFVLDFEYRIDPKSKTMAITKYLGNAVYIYKRAPEYFKFLRGNYGNAQITIPSHVAGYAVTEIGDNCFSTDASENSRRIQSIEILNLPSTLKKIGKSAFWGCFINRITIPDTVTEIGEEAFSSSELYEITLSKKLTVLPNGIFAHCKRLREISIPSSVKSIERNAFLDCQSLTKINLLRHVSVDKNAFSSCPCKITYR